MTTPAPSFRFYRVADLADLPGVEWQVDDLLPVGAASMLYGAKGTYKTFVGLALACAIASGRPVFGRAVRRGVVVYAGLEGFLGFNLRFDAWKAAHDIPAEDTTTLAGLVVVRDPVFLHAPAHVAAFLAALREYGVTRASQVMFDTLARCSVGSDEKDNAHRDQILEGLTYVRRELGSDEVPCGTTLVHHTGYDESRQRGGSALPAGLDTILRLSEGVGGPELYVVNHRDAEGGLTIPLHMGKYEGSLVALARDTGAEPTVTPKALRALRALADVELDGRGASNVEWQQATGLPNGTYHRIRKQLFQTGLVSQAKARAPWATTEAGKAALSHGTTTGLPRDKSLPFSHHLPMSIDMGGGRSGPVQENGTSEAGPTTADNFCRHHPGSGLMVSPVTQELACWECTPGLFPERARVMEGGKVLDPEPAARDGGTRP